MRVSPDMDLEALRKVMGQCATTFHAKEMRAFLVQHNYSHVEQCPLPIWHYLLTRMKIKW